MAKRNKAIDAWLKNSQELNASRAENQGIKEAREAVGEDPESPHVDPTDEEAPSATEEPPAETETPPEAAASDEGGESAEDKAAREQAEAEAARAAAAATAKPEDEERERNARAERDRLKRERDEAKRQLAQMRAQWDEQQRRQPTQAAPTETQPPAKKEPDDPEPNATEFPVEHDQWLARQARREAAAAREETRLLREELEGIKNISVRSQHEQEFDATMAVERQAFVAEHPDFEARREYLRENLRHEKRLNGVPEGRIETEIVHDERVFLASQTAMAQRLGEPFLGQYALQKLAEMADARGYRAEAETAAPKPTATNGNGAKPATQKTPQEKLADQRERVSAARTASTMSGTPAETFDPTKPMTADRFLGMTWQQREAYKKKQGGGDTVLAKIFGGDDEGSANPILTGGRR